MSVVTLAVKIDDYEKEVLAVIEDGIREWSPYSYGNQGAWYDPSEKHTISDEYVFYYYETFEEIVRNNAVDFEVLEIDGTDINEFI